VIRAALVALALAGCSPTPIEVAMRQAVAAPGFVEVATLTDQTGMAIRGAGAQLGRRVYWMAGERGPNGTYNCSSTAHWNDAEHLKHCPGALISVSLDGDADIQVAHAFDQLDARGQNDGGYHPYGTPLAVDGCLVGVTQVGGRPTGAGIEADTAAGAGTLWRYCPDTGAFETLHNFFAVGRALDGEYPMGTPALTPDGRICGTTKGGGALSRGTVWCWSASGFDYVPLSPATGTAYGGLTYSGGSLHFSTNDGAENGVGAYVRADAATLALTVVDSWPAFTGSQCCNDNTSIQAPTRIGTALVMARQFEGSGGTGLVVRLDPTAGISVLGGFEPVVVDAVPRFSNTTGGMANGRVTEAPNGMVMGTAAYGGAAGAGGIYELARDGTRQRLVHSFDPGGPSYPYGGLMTTTDGEIYGSTFSGTIFKFAPPIEACP